MKIKCLLFAVMTFVVNFTVSGQISEGGIPPSFVYQTKSLLKSSIQQQTLIPLRSIEELKEEDEQVPKIGYPQRVGTLIPVEIDLYKDGRLTELSNGDQIIRYTINSPNAIGMMLYYSSFYIPEGGKLFIYSQDKKQVIGAYTHNTNPKTKKYATEAIYGDQLTLEYVVSKTSKESPKIIIEEVSYLYSEHITNSLKGQSLPCMIDISCPEGADWQTQKRGAVRISMKFNDGSYWCSGSLVNNTALDKKPYILSADHCFFQGTEGTDFSTTIFTFNFEREECGIPTGNKGYTTVGSTLQARNPVDGGSDGALVLLNNNVLDQWEPYYNGWDATGNIPNNGVIIHHPNGDFKKITTYTEKPSIHNGTINFDGPITALRAHWKVIYSSSVTQGGSSGSPMFNENKLIVGTLSGGSSDCKNSDAPDYYGRMYYHWDQHSNSEHHFKKFLDPTNSGVKILQGMDFDGSSIEENSLANKNGTLVLFPSPVRDQLNINYSDIIREVIVTNILGKRVFSVSDLSSSTFSISDISWEKGIYNVSIKTNEGNIVTQKIIKL